MIIEVQSWWESYTQLGYYFTLLLSMAGSGIFLVILMGTFTQFPFFFPYEYAYKSRSCLLPMTRGISFRPQHPLAEIIYSPEHTIIFKSSSHAYFIIK